MLEKQPTTTSKEMKSWLMSGEQKFDLTLVNPSTLHKFINRNMDRFKTMGTMDRIAGSGGWNKVSKQDIAKIKRLALNKKRRSGRRVAAMVGGSKDTVTRYLRKSGAKPYHRRKVQVMKPEHREKRVQFARWAGQQKPWKLAKPFPKEFPMISKHLRWQTSGLLKMCGQS